MTIVSDRIAVPDAASLCTALATAWTILCDGPLSLPFPRNVFILPLTERRGRRSSRTVIGHFARSRWRVLEDGQHEIAINPGIFNKPADVLETLIHEGAHAILVDEAGGCTQGGYYHTKHFRDVALSMGLDCTFHDRRYGWTDTVWPDGQVPDQYQPVLKYLTDNLVATASICISRPAPTNKPLPAPGRLRLVCKCLPPRIIYATPTVARGGGIQCEVCSQPFVISIGSTLTDDIITLTDLLT